MGKTVAVIGDLHFAPKCESAAIREHVVEGQIKFLSGMASRLRESGVTTAIFAGDVFTNHELISSDAMEFALKFFGEMLSGIDVHIIAGNHDLLYENSSEITSIRPLGLLPNVTIYVESVGHLSMAGHDWYLVPWVTPAKLVATETWLAKLASDGLANTNVIVGHFDMRGALMEARQISECGFEPANFHKAAANVFSGHYHCPSVMESKGNIIRYVGSPYHLSFAHVGTSCGYYLVDPDTMECEYIENTESPRFESCIDTDIDSLGDMNGKFLRLFMKNGRSHDESAMIKLKAEGCNPICIKYIPYGDDIIPTDDVHVIDDEESRRIMSTDSLGMAEMYMDRYPEDLPELSTGEDAKNAILKFLNEYDNKRV